MAELNLKYFDGNNYYSDGDIEDVILDMVKNGRDYMEMAGTQKLYPVMYHLSEERQNILNWYPFKKTDEILEVGAGCGAITGLLCRLAGHVTCNELSKRRSEINYERNKAYDNLEIIVGNLNEVVLDRKYDYVILNGVFEYAMSFTEGENPYVTFLNAIKEKLKEDGKILIAIENRLGIKYFAGAMEDHTNDYFVGLNNYVGNNTVRTFSKKELEHIFRQCGIEKWKFYYPYPDYKFPTEIFTDENVNGVNFGKVYRNYQKNRVSLFSENHMTSVLKEEKVMDVFANSFLVELQIGNVTESKVSYAKMNATRKEEYCIATVIGCKEDEKYVQKMPLNDKAVSHIERIYKNQNGKLPEKYEYLQGKMIGGAIEYPYLEEENVDYILLRYLAGREKEKILSLTDKICQAFTALAEQRQDFYDENFIRYFGEENGIGESACIKDCNIDIIFDNLFLKEDKFIVIDPEWIYEGWLPVKFVIWRMLNEWYSKYREAESCIPFGQMLARYEISEQESNIYRKWAIHFANCFVSSRDMDQCVDRIKEIDIRGINSKKIPYSTVFIDYGQGFGEENKEEICLDLKEGSFALKLALDSDRKIEALRWDPVEYQACICKVEKCLLDGKEIQVLPINAETANQELFLTMDPQYRLIMEPGCYETLEISGKLECMDESDYILQKMNILEAENMVCRIENGTLISQNGELKQEKERLQSANEELVQKEERILEESKQLREANEHMEDANRVLQSQNEQMRQQNEELMIKAAHMTDELDMIKNSKFWKILVKYWNIKGKMSKERK